MRKMWLLILLVTALLSGEQVALALSESKPHVVSEAPVSGTADDDMAGDAPTRKLTDYIKNYVDIPAGALDWKTLGTTGSVNMEGKLSNGYDFQYFKPRFTPAVRKLDGTVVTLRGFMFPLDPTEKQALFLFGPFPLSCPFHYHVAPALVVEVHAGKKPVKFSYDPVTLRGRLQLVEKDIENSTFYRLQDAEEVR